ncbi:hypothetical protein QAD02_022592 [Eretmocerus hayati]|uniref:Uncharacterized protein n=1 Tax=Eretmocerus hayati TaxID=131215 RepID=A0ACC2PTJ6_9HYME|nr:hypothetical protein QAD02_022592 [Eretmocerus hayati]
MATFVSAVLYAHHPDCSRPQTSWGQQRDNYLDNLTWADGSCERAPECPNHSSHSNRLSRVQNLCKDPCALPATHTCSNRSNQCDPCGQTTWEGRKRNLDIQPTIPDSRSCRSTAPRTRSKSRSPCGGSGAGRNRSKEKPSCEKPCSPIAPPAQPVCCPCPESFKQQRPANSCPPKPTTCSSTSKPECRSSNQPQVCRKDSCPNYAKFKASDSSKRCSETTTSYRPRESSRCRPIEPCTRDTCPNLTRPNENRCSTSALDSATANARIGTSNHQRRSSGINCTTLTHHQQESTSPSCPPTSMDPCSTNSRKLRFESRPRLAASFENGVLEAYSQFKLVFPTSSGGTEAATGGGCVSASLQTEPTTRSCGVGVNSADLPSRHRSPSSRMANSSCTQRSPRASRSRPRSCSNARVDECGQASKCDLEADENLHDYVLLTPGGKYIPLVKTKAEQCDQRVAFADCCMDDGREEQAGAICENELPECCDEKSQRPLSDQKCDSTTTKLLLQCIENVLKLEEQEGKQKCVEQKKDPVEPCKCKPPQDTQCEKIANCLTCLQEKLKSATNSSNACPKGKLTQDLLEILKCVLEMDSSKKDGCDEEQKRDCCICDETPQKPKCPSSENMCKAETKKESCQNQAMNHDMINNCNKTEKISLSARVHTTCDKAISCQDIFAKCAIIPCSSRPPSRSKIENESQNLSQVRNDEISPDRYAYRSENENPTRRRTSRSHLHEETRDLELNGCNSQSIRRASKPSTTQMSHGVDLIVPDAGRRERILNLSKGVQVDERSRQSKRRESSVGTQKRDTVLEYLVRCATRSNSLSASNQGASSSCSRRNNPSRSPGRVFATAIPRSSIQCCDQDLDFEDGPYRSFDAEITWSTGR